MNQLLLTALLAVISSLPTYAYQVDGSVERKLLFIRVQIGVVRKLLDRDCSIQLTDDLEDENANKSVTLESRKLYYNQLATQLVACRRNGASSLNTTVTPFTVTTTSTATESTTTSTATESTTTNTAAESTTSNTAAESTTTNTAAESTTTNNAAESNTTNTATESTATNTAAESTTTNTMTTTNSLQQICSTATNFTHSWRRDHNGSHIREDMTSGRRGYACDLRADLKWFRFAGAAGSKMLNTCPKWYSCGTFIPIWTDATSPKEIGEMATVSAYGVLNGDCKSWVLSVEVIRCSETDVIYKFAGEYDIPNCVLAFCSMQ